MTGIQVPPRAPVACPPPSRTELASGRPERLIRLLVADDDARVRAAIGQTIALEPDLVIVAEAAAAAAALALAWRVSSQVALVDVLIPDEAAGLALVHCLASEPICAVVAMSVRGGLRAAALAAGTVTFVEKGSDIDAVLSAVRAAACRTRPTS